MDSEEINDIARRLTQQWASLIRSRISNKNISNAETRSFLNHLEANSRIVFKYEDQQLLDKAMDIIPLQKLFEEAELKLEEEKGGEGSLEDLVIQRLLHWFKNDFFSWVNNAPCDYCHSTQTRSSGTTQPNQEDLRFGAHVVETYQCLLCSKITRFPRYNDPGKLLETRRGRCGEWANCFTLCCRAVGAEARIVYDTTDHVWTEVYSEFEQRWIHCDSCEEAWDRPLLYSVGWNKQLNYCTAFSVNEALDVTKRYTRNWPDVLKRRNKVGEAELTLFLDGLTAKSQQHLDQSRRDELNERRIKELIQLEEDSKKSIVKDEELQGRQSGSVAWRTSRGEIGKSGSSAAEKTTENLMRDLKLDDGWKAYPSSEIEQFTLLGSASMQYDNKSFLPGNQQILRITKAVPDQRGGAYHKHAIDIDDALKGLDIEFAFRITDGNGSPAVNGADGFAFVIQAQGENALGGGGCEMGYGGIKTSLAVEFDTYQSSDRCADPSGNHISIQARKSSFANSAHHDYSLGHTSRIPSLKSGLWMKAKIRLLEHSIEIGLGEANDKEYIQVLKVENQSFKTYLNLTKAWIGFTASTGGLAENHDVQLISIVQYKST